MKPEKIYKVVDVNDELPQDNDLHFCICRLVKSEKAFYQLAKWVSLDMQWSCETVLLNVTHWLKEEPQPQYCFSADELLKYTNDIVRKVLDGKVKTLDNEYPSSLNIKP